MAIRVIMPVLAVAQETGRLVRWFKQEGEPVTKGEALMEVETEKSVVEIEAPASGMLANVTAAADDEIPVGQTIALILEKGEDPPQEAATAFVSTGPEEASASEKKTGSTRASVAATDPSGRNRTLASPAARRLAKERGVELASLQGSGPENAVVREDVLRFAPDVSTAVHPRAISKRTIQLSSMRRTIGERMTLSKQSVPHFYVNMDVDMTGVDRERSALKAAGADLVPSINDFILEAVSRALSESPAMNASLTEDGIEQFTDVNIGLAVAMDDGLVVPVIHGADKLSVVEIALRSRDLYEKAQRKKLTPLDYQGGTFTVSNLGMFGVDSFVAIINPPQAGILAVGRVAPRVVPHGEGIAIRSMMTMTLSADHRVVDGAIGARFLEKVRQRLEDQG
jgi:pyruvate dehydrogenase E2 component (dihydrolipoamide acetyltransferase)